MLQCCSSTAEVHAGAAACVSTSSFACLNCCNSDSECCGVGVYRQLFPSAEFILFLYHLSFNSLLLFFFSYFRLRPMMDPFVANPSLITSGDGWTEHISKEGRKYYYNTLVRLLLLLLLCCYCCFAAALLVAASVGSPKLHAAGGVVSLSCVVIAYIYMYIYYIFSPSSLQ